MPLKRSADTARSRVACWRPNACANATRGIRVDLILCLRKSPKPLLLPRAPPHLLPPTVAATPEFPKFPDKYTYGYQTYRPVGCVFAVAVAPLGQLDAHQRQAIDVLPGRDPGRQDGQRDRRDRRRR